MNSISFLQDPMTFIIAFLGGTLPAILWLWYWIKEDDIKKPPLGLVMLTFVTGMLMVMVVIPVEQYFGTVFTDKGSQVMVWATIEEVFKYGAFMLIAITSNYCEEPIDYPIYAMTAALGFAAFENTFYLIKPIMLSQTTVTLLTTSMRFLGSTLLHSVTTGFVGLFVGLAFFQSKTLRLMSLLLGFVFAISLHSVFNFFIMEGNGENFLQVFAILWVASIISVLVFEKVRRMSQDVHKEEIQMREMPEPYRS